MALAACLAGGIGVAASHETAAALMWLDGVPTIPRVIHLTSVRRIRLADASVRVHETTRPFGIRSVQGVPATSVERMLLDLAATESAAATELALEDALRRRLTSISRLDQAVVRDGGSGRPGAGVLRKLVDERRGSPPTESGLEAKVAMAFSNARLPGLVKQYPLTRPGGAQVRIDLAFPHAKVAVEVDSYRWHSGRDAWRRDLARRNDLIALGWTVLHATKEDVDNGCVALTRTVRELIGSPLDLDGP
jgi:very-short-patch-repair endonuclease